MIRIARVVLAAVISAGMLGMPAGAGTAAADTPTSEFAFEAPQSFFGTSWVSYTGTVGVHAIDPEFPHRDELSTYNDVWWIFELEGPDGAALTVGSYTDARSLANTAPGKAVFSPMTSSDMCNDPRTAFTVNAIERDMTGMLTKLDMSYELACPGVAEHVLGEMRYRTSDNPIAVLVNSPMWLSKDAWQQPYGHIPVGSTGAPRTFTFTAAGRLDSQVGTPAVEGADAADFTISTDTCAGTTLGQGQTCTVSVAFTPTAGSIRTAELVVPSNATTGTHRIRLAAEATTLTTTTIELLNNPAFGPGALQATVTVAPNPHGGQAGIKHWAGSYWNYIYAPLDTDGRAVLTNYPSGQIFGYYPGNDLYESSVSEAVTQVLGSASSISLTSGLNPQEVTKNVSLTATVSIVDGGPAPAAGTMQLVDETTDTVLATLDVATGTQLTYSGLFSLGDHALKATYLGATTPGLVGPSSATLTQHVVVDQKVDASGFGLSYGTFYPVKDGYRDSVGVRGTLGEAASVSIKAVSVATGKTVRTVSLGTRPVGAYAWTWNGTNSAGTRQAAGQYRVVQTVTDTVGNRLVSTQSLVLSKRAVAWKTRTITKNGAAYARWGGTGTVSTSKSSYTHGVYLSAGGEWAAATYTLRIPSALAYRTVKFKVLGRSRSTDRAWIALWNPSLGSYLNLDNYDRWARAGTAYGTYPVSGTGSTHQKSHLVRGAVYVEVAGPKPQVFDVAKVYATVTYAVWR